MKQTIDFAQQARLSLEGAARLIRRAGLFDENFYSASRIARAAGIDPAVHYLQTGEPAGLRPAPQFDPAYYRAKYPDVGVGGLSPLIHYGRFGLGHRRTLPIASEFSFPTSGLHAERETVLLLVPDASRSPSAILGLNICRRLSEQFNLVAVLLNGGEMGSIFSDAVAALVSAKSRDEIAWDFLEGEYLARQLLLTYRPKFAIANGVPTRFLIPAIARSFVPVIALAEVESASLEQTGSLAPFFHDSAAIVFGSDTARQASISQYPILSARETLVLSLGQSRESFESAFGAERVLIDVLVAALVDCGTRYAGRGRRQQADFDTILASGDFDPDFYFGSAEAREPPSKGELVRSYILASTPSLHKGAQRISPLFRNGLPGFNPLIYASESKAYSSAPGENPMAHYIRHQCPDGRWKHPLIAFEGGRDEALPDLRVGLHGHFFYAELFPDFLSRLHVNRMRADLWITTDSEEKRAAIRQAATSYALGEVEIRLVPNLGRDLGAFLTGFPDKLLEAYDVVGHLHGKRSLAGFAGKPGDNGDRWREFLWENLLGRLRPMMDKILCRFAEESNLGLVFPEDANLFGWSSNREIAEELARKMGLATPLPSAIDFPAGNMFWARPAALTPLFEMKLNWTDYPAEPLALDGTMLHALERLMPLIVSRQGFSYATARVEGIDW